MRSSSPNDGEGHAGQTAQKARTNETTGQTLDVFEIMDFSFAREEDIDVLKRLYQAILNTAPRLLGGAMACSQHLASVRRSSSSISRFASASWGVKANNVGPQELSLKQELEFLERYLELEQIRFQDRLQVEMEIEPETLDAQVPNLILQPLVENAIRHGIAATASAGLLRIRAHCEEEKLCVEIRDNGPGLSFSGNPEGEGVGLSNTRKRLNRLYGERHRFTVENGEDGGAVAFLEIPLRYAH